MRTKVGLRAHAILGITGCVLLPMAWLFSQHSHRMACTAVAFGISGVAFALNGYLGVTRSKMHMRIPDVVSRRSRGEKMFKMDIATQFAGAVLCFAVASWFLLRALR
jgi:hypothetical protein